MKKINIDMYIFLPILFLNMIGSLVLYSSSGSVDVVISQNIKFFVGLFLMFLISLLPSDKVISVFSKPFYYMVLFLLFCVFLFGVENMGAKRWLNLYVFNIQPSELMKLALPMFLSYLIFKNGLPRRAMDLFIYMVLIMAPISLVLVQPDLGTSILIAMSGIYVLFQSGLSWVLISIVSSFVFLSIPLLWGVIKEYQKERIITMFNPEADPLGSGYHIIQSKTAIGNGGFFGDGFLSGTQTQLGFIPEQHTDFVFTALAEEFGFLGFLLIMFLYMIIIFRVFYLSLRIENVYSKLLIGSINMVFVSYIFVNLGMVSGILPVVGVPLPFISYGGTFVITQLISFGVVLSLLSDTSKMKKAYQ